MFFFGSRSAVWLQSDLRDRAFFKEAASLKKQKKCDFFYKKSKQLCLNNVKCSSNMFYLFVLNKSCK